MAKSILKIVEQISPEREKLAAAIKKLKEKNDELAACADDWETRARLRERVEEAKKTLEAAKVAAVQFAIDQARGCAGDPPLSVKEARQALQDLEDQLAVSETMRDALKARADELSKEVGWAKISLESAVLGVCRASPEVLAIYEQLMTLQRTLAGQRKLCQAIVGLPSNWQVLHNPDDADDVSAEIAAWRSAIDNLSRDATTPLPTKN